MRHPVPQPTRRTLALALPAGLGGLLGLAACTADEPSPSGSTSPDGADAPPPPQLPETPIDPTPTVEGMPAPTVIGTDLRLPLEMTVMIVARPGWTAPTQQLDGMFLGYAAEEDALRFLAVSEEGTLAWSARRPLSCTGFALSRTGEGRAVAVLADLAADGGDGTAVGASDGGADAQGGPVVRTTVTCYDLATAESQWGPTPVPGPQVAPGLVFAAGVSPREDDGEQAGADDERAGSGGERAGSGGTRVALSADTGDVAVSEADLDGGRIIAEHLGTILHTRGEALVAVSATDGEQLWDLDLPAGTDPAAVHVAGEISPDTSLAVIAGPGKAGASGGLLVDLRDGSVLAEGVSAATRDLATDTTVVVSGTVVTGRDASGAETWRHVDVEPLQLVSAGERLAYAVRPGEGTLVVLDTHQGRMIQPYDADATGTLGMPETFTAEAAVAVRFEDERYLVTTVLDEAFGMRT